MLYDRTVESDTQCADGDVAGVCELDVGVCSFPDDECESRQRYGTFAGGVAGMCVPPSDGSSAGDTEDASTTTSDDPTAASTDPATTDEGTTSASTTDDPTSPVSASDSTSDRSASDGGTGGGSNRCPCIDVVHDLRRR